MFYLTFSGDLNISAISSQVLTLKFEGMLVIDRLVSICKIGIFVLLYF